jgi:hypothetical protein
LEVFGKKFGSGGVLTVGQAFAGLREEIGAEGKNGGEEDKEGEEGSACQSRNYRVCENRSGPDKTRAPAHCDNG